MVIHFVSKFSSVDDELDKLVGRFPGTWNLTVNGLDVKENLAVHLNFHESSQFDCQSADFILFDGWWSSDGGEESG